MNHPFSQQHPLFYTFQPPSSFEIPNFQNSFLDNLSSIMQNSSQVEEDVEGNPTIVQLVETSEDDQQQQPNLNEHESGSGSENSDSGGSDSGSGSENSDSGSQEQEGSDDDKDAALLRAYNLLQQLQNSKKQKKHAKVVPIVSNKKSVKFQKEEDDIREIEIPDQGAGEEKESSRYPEEEELQGLVRQLVLLETEESKAQQFLEYIQKYNCFDKQDQMLVRHFLEQIYYEKKTLLVVLNNYGTHIQPLITMMSIAERRLTLLDQTNLITPDSTLHTSLVDKQKQLQAIIEEACDHIFHK